MECLFSELNSISTTKGKEGKCVMIINAADVWFNHNGSSSTS